MTTKQKQQATVKFAKAMGWECVDEDAQLSVISYCSPGDKGAYAISDGKVFVLGRGGITWDPFDSTDDATELADRLGIYYRRDYYQVPERQFAAWRQSKQLDATYPNDSDKSYEVRGGTLREAICTAALAKITGDENEL